MNNIAYSSVIITKKDLFILVKKMRRRNLKGDKDQAMRIILTMNMFGLKENT